MKGQQATNSLLDEIMGMHCIRARWFHLAAWVLVLEVITGFSGSPQAFSAPSARASGTNGRQSSESAGVASPTTVVTHATVSHESQKTIVRVITNREAVYKTMRLSDPERVVLDFQRARLAIPPTIRSSYFPVQGVRAGQFKQDVVRVVIDLEEAAPYRIHVQNNTVTVEFDAENSVSRASPATSQIPPHNATGTSRSTTGAPAIANADAGVITAAPPKPAPESPVNRVPIESAPTSAEPSFANGMLTFRVQNQPLRSAVMRIGIQSGVAITMGEDLGTELVSVEFRHYRIDEALRQMLKDYDTFFLYGGDDGNEEATSLKAVWVYPKGHGQEFLKLSRDKE